MRKTKTDLSQSSFQSQGQKISWRGHLKMSMFGQVYKTYTSGRMCVAQNGDSPPLYFQCFSLIFIFGVFGFEKFWCVHILKGGRGSEKVCFVHLWKCVKTLVDDSIAFILELISNWKSRKFNYIRYAYVSVLDKLNDHHVVLIIISPCNKWLSNNNKTTWKVFIVKRRDLFKNRTS